MSRNKTESSGNGTAITAGRDGFHVHGSLTINKNKTKMPLTPLQRQLIALLNKYDITESYTAKVISELSEQNS